MKRFLSKVISMCVILGILLLLLNAAYMSTAYYRDLNDMGKFSDMPKHIDIVNFGNSHAFCCFDWGDYKEFAGANMALPSQTITYDEAILNQYFGHLHEGSLVVLEISFRSLYEEEVFSEESSAITRYYRVLSRGYFKHWNLADAIKYKYLPVLGDRGTAILKIVEEWTDAGEMSELQEKEPDLSDMSAFGQERADTFMQQSGSQELGEQYEALVRIIEKCKSNDIQIILITAPTMSCFYEGFTEEFLDKFYADMEEISKTYDVRYIDYTGDARFPDDKDLFKDPDHMTAYGSKLFTEVFLQDNASVLWFYNGTG